MAFIPGSLPFLPFLALFLYIHVSVDIPHETIFNRNQMLLCQNREKNFLVNPLYIPASMYLMNSLSCLTTGQIYSAESQKGDISERICDSNFNRPTLSGESSVGNKLTFFRPCSISKTKCRPGFQCFRCPAS